MLVIFVFVQCVALGHAELFISQPVVTSYFYESLREATEHHVEHTYVATLRSIQFFLEMVYVPCQETRKKKIDRQFSAQVLYPGLCGTIGYTDPRPIYRKWTINMLDLNTGIKFTVLYLSFPFLGSLCEFSNVTISSYSNMELCGEKSGLVVYSKYHMFVILNQGYRLSEEHGFIAVYAAFQSDAFPQKESHIFWVRSRYTLSKESPFSLSLPQDAAYAWHIEAAPYKIIYFYSKNDDCKVYDGPWHKSPILRGLYTSGNRAYIVQIHRYPLLNYTTILNTNFQEGSQIHVVSLAGRNTIYAKKVPPGEYSLVVSYLAISYTDTAGPYWTRCHSGGLFVYSALPGPQQTQRLSKEFDFCQTQNKKEFTLHLPDPTAEYYVYVILYSGYSEGQVKAHIEPRRCANLLTRVTMAFGCNFIQHIFYTDDPFAVHFQHALNTLGPMIFRLQVVNLIYSIPVQGLSMFGSDQSIYLEDQYRISINITDNITHHFDNAGYFGVKYEPKDFFNTVSVLLIEVQNRKFANDFSYTPYVENTTILNVSHISFLLKYNLNLAIITGLTDYRITAIADHPLYRHVEAKYDHKRCEETCNDKSKAFVTQYIASRRIHHTQTQIFLPLLWANTMTQGSFEVVISVHEECRQCLLVITMQSMDYINSTIQKGSSMHDRTQPNR